MMHRLQHFVGHGGGSGDGQKFPARANGHFFVFLMGRYAESKRMRFGYHNMGLEPSLRATRSHKCAPDDRLCEAIQSRKKDQIALIAPLIALPARCYFPTALAIARQI